MLQWVIVIQTHFPGPLRVLDRLQRHDGLKEIVPFRLTQPTGVFSNMHCLLPVGRCHFLYDHLDQLHHPLIFVIEDVTVQHEFSDVFGIARPEIHFLTA